MQRLAHAELVILRPEDFCRDAQAVLTGQLDAKATRRGVSGHYIEAAAAGRISESCCLMQRKGR